MDSMQTTSIINSLNNFLTEQKNHNNQIDKSQISESDDDLNEMPVLEQNAFSNTTQLLKQHIDADRSINDKQKNFMSDMFSLINEELGNVNVVVNNIAENNQNQEPPNLNLTFQSLFQIAANIASKIQTKHNVNDIFTELPSVSNCDNQNEMMVENENENENENMIGQKNDIDEMRNDNNILIDGDERAIQS